MVLSNCHAQIKVTLSKLLRTMSSWVLSTSKDKNTTTLLGNLLKCLITNILMNIFFFCLNRMSVCTIASTGSSLFQCFLLISIRYLQVLKRCFLSLLLSTLNNPIFHSLSFYDRCFTPLIIIMVIHWTFFL